MSNLEGTKSLVVGASRGFGRGMAVSLVEAGADVCALSRSDPAELARAAGRQIREITADATDPEVASRVVREVKPVGRDQR